MPIITLEVLTDSTTDQVHEQTSHDEKEINDKIANFDSEHDSNAGLHFLTEKPNEQVKSEDIEDKETSKSTRADMLEYMTRNDGSVVCKLCGEILQSRTHWYRHKYKLHVIQPLNPAPLFQCEHCLVFFKSRKGYIGHIASRHSEVLSDSSPVLTNIQSEATSKEKPTEADQTESVPPEEQEGEQPDPELSIPKTSVPNYQTTAVQQALAKLPEAKKPMRRVSKSSESKDSPNRAELEEKRSREEKLVADIIDRVRRECEAQGSGGATRRGYTRRYTVMHT